MSNFRISPLSKEKLKHRRHSFPWLCIFIAIETLAAGVYIFQLHEGIDYLESQVSTRNREEQNNV